jgi:Predicted membrane protein
LYFEIFIFVIEMIGTTAFAVSGALTAIQKKLDTLGIIVLGCTTAIGGGVLRDVLLGNLPPNSFIHSSYIMVASAVSLALFFAAYRRSSLFKQNIAKFMSAINLFDAIGLGVFAVNGTSVAIQCGFAENGFLAVFVGVLTAVGGGIIRDLMVCEIPLILRKRIYALAALCGAGVYYYMQVYHLSPPLAMLTGIAVTILIRLLATHYNWALPKIND